MTALELMQRLRNRGEDLKRLQEQLDIRRDAATRITSKPPDAVGGGGGGGDKMAAYAAQVDELLGRVARVKKLWQVELSYCVKLSDEYEGAKKLLLYNYYGKAWTLRGVAKHAGYSEGYMRKLKNELDQELQGRRVNYAFLPEDYMQ